MECFMGRLDDAHLPRQLDLVLEGSAGKVKHGPVQGALSFAAIVHSCSGKAVGAWCP